MAFRSRTCWLTVASFALVAVSLSRAQVFVVGEKSAMEDVSTDFHPTRVELPSTLIDERGRRELVRNLEAEQGFAHRALPLGDSLVLVANGNLNPVGEAYKQMLYKKGQSAAPGDRIVITMVTVKADRIVFDLNGGPYLKHRFLRHLELDGAPLAADDGAQVTGCRVTLIFEGGLPDIGAPDVKALLDPIIDFGVKTSAQAYADTLPPFLRNAIAHHDVLVGMDRRLVLVSLGAPLSKERELIEGSSDKHYEEWIYGQVPQTVRFVRFVGDRVVQVRVAELGQSIAVMEQNQMRGYLDSEDETHEVARGDARPGNGETGAAKPPSMLKPGEVAPGGPEQRPVALPRSGAGGSGPTPTTPSESTPKNALPSSASSL